MPGTNATSTLTLPRNAKKAIFTVSACGQIDEEFWWSNVLLSDTGTFGPNSLLGYSPFREVQILIDGELAGVSWPFPVIFTGGIVPGFWRPIVGIDTFDLKEDEIDVTPWLSILSDGNPHTFEIRVVGITDDGHGNGVLTTVGSYWVVSGKLFLWLDQNANGKPTTGTPIRKVLSDPTFSIQSSVGATNNGTNMTLNYEVLAQRRLSFSSVLTTSEGTAPASWMQTLSYSNVGNVTEEGLAQRNVQLTKGVDQSSSGYARTVRYPLDVLDSVTLDSTGNLASITGRLDRGKSVQVVGNSALPAPARNSLQFDGSSISTRQNGSAFFERIPSQNISVSSGSTEQSYTSSGLEANIAAFPSLPSITGSTDTYSRHVLAVNGSIVADSNPSGLEKIIAFPPRSGAGGALAQEDLYALPSTLNKQLGRPALGLKLQ